MPVPPLRACHRPLSDCLLFRGEARGSERSRKYARDSSYFWPHCNPIQMRPHPTHTTIAHPALLTSACRPRSCSTSSQSNPPRRGDPAPNPEPPPQPRAGSSPSRPLSSPLGLPAIQRAAERQTVAPRVRGWTHRRLASVLFARARQRRERRTIWERHKIEGPRPGGWRMKRLALGTAGDSDRPEVSETDIEWYSRREWP